MPPLIGRSSDSDGVQGWTTNDNQSGVAGVAQSGGNGMYAESANGNGLIAFSNSPVPGKGFGVHGESKSSVGVHGVSHAPEQAAVLGENVNGSPQAGPGVMGVSPTRGILGVGKTWHGVEGRTESNTGGAGVYGQGTNIGVFGESSSGVGVLGRGSLAGKFEGRVEVQGVLDVAVDITLHNGDCAEEFDIATVEKVNPGTVMVLGAEGALHPSHQAYDKRVAGIVSGAGHYQPAIILDRQEGLEHRQPIALMGKVFCKVDAAYGPVEIGDLLTTSPTLGYAMKAGDPTKAFGAVIGKALRPLEEGQALIPVLVALQ